MLSHMTDNSVSQSWMEHQSLEHIKKALRVTIQWETPAISFDRKRSSVTFAMECFARHLQRLMELEEEDGYMQVVAETKPSKAKRVATLRDDHGHFRLALAKLSNELKELDEWQEAEFDQICGEIDDLLSAIDKHDRSEVRLLQETLVQDDGVGD